MRCRRVSSSLPVPYKAPWDWAFGTFLGLLHIEIAAFHTELNRLVSVALIVGSPRMAVSHYVSHCSPDFPLPNLTAMLRLPEHC